MQLQEPVQDFLSHLSEKPWSDYTAADYTVEQWHASCLIHQHEGPPTSKDQCKLPVKTPSGSLNRNGVHAASAALAGARGGVHASSEEKAKAANALVRYYRQMDEEPPASLLRHSVMNEYIEHHGVKGMKWGQRKSRSAGSGGGPKAKPKRSSDAKKVAELKKRKPSQLSNKQLKSINERMNLEQNFRRMNPSTLSKGKAAVAGLVATAGLGVAAYNIVKSPAGQAAINAGKKAIESQALRKAASKAARSAGSGQLRLPGI